MKTLMIWALLVAVVVAMIAPYSAAAPEENQEGPDSLLSNLEASNADSKPFNLQGASSQRRAHGIYFNGR